MKKVTFLLLSLLFVGVGKAYADGETSSNVNNPQEDIPLVIGNTTVISSVVELSEENNKNLYIIAPQDGRRGALFAESEDMKVGRCGNAGNLGNQNASNVYNFRTDVTIGEGENLDYQLFAFIFYNGKHYMYNLGTGAFCTISSDNNNRHVALSKDKAESVSIKSCGDNYFSLILGGNKRICFSNAGGNYHAVRLNFENDNSGWNDDTGNKMRLYKVEKTLTDGDLDAAIDIIERMRRVIDEQIKGIEPFIEESKKGTVGYPSSVSDLEGIIKRFGSASDADLDDIYTDLQNAIRTYKQSINVNMPVSGKAYRIKAKYADGSTRYLKFDAEAAINSTTRGRLNVSEKMPAEDDHSALFICRDNKNGTYSLVYNGGYLVYYADGKPGLGGCNSGCSDVYTDGSNNAELTLIHATATSGTLSHIGSIDADEALGSLCMKALNTNKDDNGLYYFMAGTSNFHNSGQTDIAFSDTHSSFFYFEEVEYPNKPNMTQTELGEDYERNENYIATFSAPFATVVPNGLIAYIVTGTTSSGEETKAEITRIANSGNAIPANTGVLLYGRTEDATMIPATTETSLNVEAKNWLQHTAGAVKSKPGDNVYLLGKQIVGEGTVTAFYKWGEGVLGMNKAYLEVPAGASVRSISLNFGQQVTGIETATTHTGNSAAALYDLSGRRVTHAAKGGIYIRDGKKIFVK